jgi:hypothetical protein
MAAGSSMLETSPLVLVAILSIFIAACFVIEFGLHKLEHHLARRVGLLAALGNMKNEVMLLGLASLVLLAFEDELSSVCGKLTPERPPSCAARRGLYCTLLCQNMSSTCSRRCIAGA